MCDVNGTDPFTDEFQLCDNDGWVRRGAMHHGEDYLCTSHAHFAGMHIRCTSPAHAPKVYVSSAFNYVGPGFPSNWAGGWISSGPGTSAAPYVVPVTTAPTATVYPAGTAQR
jgi:hypothetical protein